MRCINCNSEALMTVEPIHVPEIIATLHIYHYCAQSWCDAEDVDSWRDYCRENFIKVVI
jgi:hypothetical protein